MEFYASTEGNISFVNYTGKIGAVGRVNCLQKVRRTRPDILSFLVKFGILPRAYARLLVGQVERNPGPSHEFVQGEDSPQVKCIAAHARYHRYLRLVQATGHLDLARPVEM